MTDIRVIANGNLHYEPAPGRDRADPLQGLGADAESVRIVRLSPGVRRFAHKHPHSAEIMYVVDGTGEVRSGDDRVSVATGDFIYVPTDVTHAMLPADGTEMLLVCFFAHPDLEDNTVEMGEIT